MHTIPAIWWHSIECSLRPSRGRDDDLSARSQRIDQFWHGPPDEIETQQNNAQYLFEEVALRNIGIPGKEIGLRRSLPSHQMGELGIDGREHRDFGP